MNKKDVIDFFNMLAPSWDSDMVKSDEIITKILDTAKIGANQDVLDVACGTGVMFDYYLDRNVNSVTGIDIAPKMAEIAKDKYKGNPKVSVVCGDVCETVFDTGFDAVVVYNAFPHFPCPEKLIAHLATLLKQGGVLTVAHGESREKIDARHSGSASKVSLGLMPAEDLARLFEPYFKDITIISDSRMYQVCGKLK